MGEWTKEPWMARTGLFAPHQDGYRDCDIQICSKDLLHVATLHSELPTGAPNANRIVACVNAMQGIPDPAKFVEAFHAMLSALRYSHAIVKNISLGGKEHHNGAADDAVVLIERAIDKALAAKPTDPPQEAKR